MCRETKPIKSSSSSAENKKSRLPYIAQPTYRTQLAPLNKDDNDDEGRTPKTVVVNQKLCENPEFQRVLFGRLTPQEERKVHWWCVRYWALAWVGILAYAHGYLHAWLMYAVVALSCIRHSVIGHHCCHLKNPLPFPFRLTGFGLFCAGFMPLASTFGDVEYQHLTVHHPETKGVIDTDDDDPHSRLARMSLPRMMLTCFISPGHVCMEDVIVHFLLKNPASLWPERIVVNLVHWANLYAMYQLVGQTMFWKILTVGHFSMWILWLFFNGLLHHVEFHRFMIACDPSGMRYIHPVVESLFYLLSSDAWLEIKWHDIHHAMHVSATTFGLQMARGITYQELAEACANLVDQGLYLDAVTKEPVSPLAEVGHKIGSRKAYLKAHQKKQQVPHAEETEHSHSE